MFQGVWIVLFRLVVKRVACFFVGAAVGACGDFEGLAAGYSPGLEAFDVVAYGQPFATAAVDEPRFEKLPEGFPNRESADLAQRRLFEEFVQPGHGQSSIRRLNRHCTEPLRGSYSPILSSVARTVALAPRTDADLLRLAGALERLSEHPLGKAIAAHAEKALGPTELPSAEGFRMIPGVGVTGTVDGHLVEIGRNAPQDDEALRLLDAQIEEAGASGETISFVVVDGKLAGFLSLEDKLRPFSKRVVSELKSLRVVPVLLTGDREAAARHAAGEVGILSVLSQCRPETKLAYMEREAQAGTQVLMVGDGVNDAPALKRAAVGVAMGGVGSGIALEAADIVAVGDRIDGLPDLISLSRRMMRVIRINLTLAMTINFIAIILAMGGWMGPVVGALVHNAGSVAVIIHSASLLGVGKRTRTHETLQVKAAA